MSSNSGGAGLLIIGICSSAIDIPVKLGAIKKALIDYNGIPKKVTYLEQSKLNFIATGNGIGFQF